MSDTTAEPVEQVSFVAPTLPPINDPALQSRLDALLAQREATYEQQQRSFEARVNAEFERRLLETVLSNCTCDRGSLCPTYNKPFDLFVKANGTGNWRREWDSNPR